MTWSILFCLVLVLGLAVVGLLQRRSGLHATSETLAERDTARRTGSADAQLQYPAVDLTRCVGCGACVRACPEEGVLGLAHGQAVVIHGARCVGHARCAEVCPVDAVAVTLGDLSERSDIPALDDSLEAIGTEGLFLAGEVTGYALVRTAIRHGRSVADQVAARVAQRTPVATAPSREGAVAVAEAPIHDLLIVGAGPAGIACGLAAKGHDLDFRILERDTVGGTVAKYPRRKLVMTQPVELPLYGKLAKTSYVKEELIEIWESIVREHDLPIQTGAEFTGLTKDDDGAFTVRTAAGEFRAHQVCLCMGRRGTPRRLGVPGEELPKVVYSLIDAESYRGRHILVVGGGDSAIEAAVGLAEQPGNRVTLSYRKAEFFRIKPKNRARLDESVAAGGIRLVLESSPLCIESDRIRLQVAESVAPDGVLELPNDDVFIFAGGIPPFGLLEESGVSFDGSMRPPTVEAFEKGTGLLRALVISLALTLGTLAFCAAFRSYYASDWSDRPESPWHDWLAPTGKLGLSMGFVATALILVNLAYLARRSRLGRFLTGSIQNWLSLHAVTGILALLFLLVHGGMVVRSTSGGLAFVAVAILVASGGVGRYFYAHLPKAANGRSLERDEARDSLRATLGELDHADRGLEPSVRQEIEALLEDDPWGRSMGQRIAGLWRHKRRLPAQLHRIEAAAHAADIAADQVEALVRAARNVSHASMMAGHFEDLRGLVGSWRVLHRWLALAMVILAANHIAVAIRYARLWG